MESSVGRDDERGGTCETATNRPIDGPAVEFEPDHLVSMIVEGVGKFPNPPFSLALVAGWPPDRRQLESPYQRFVDAVAQCWDKADTQGQTSPVYLYPFDALHVTAAIFFRITSDLVTKEEEESLVLVWKRILRKATERDDWPSSRLRLRVLSSQIGKKAGILLWEDETGQLDRIRHCVEATCTAEQAVFDQAGISASLQIPNIIHSTFLRFYGKPITPGELVQQRFRELVLPKLPDMFPDHVEVSTLRLVCERMPYMHMPNDANHVFVTCTLSNDASVRFQD